ncbi:MAG: peptidoglycan DD-metalloendopeptidase family protein [Bacteroidetes bacterium]|nr:peptidoglycan DD-metalloendopeptidase family protein [Bacteroidota bacterium]
MKFTIINIIFTSFLFIYCFTLQAQEDGYKKLDPIYIIETANDSIDIASNFYSFYDSLAVFFEDDTLYSSFDNEIIHYPKVDFSNKTDTTILFLTDASKKSFYVNPHNGEVTSRFGLRHRRYHYGTDINLETGDSVLSAFDGRVRITKLSSSYGYVIVIRHLNGVETLYAHLSQINVTNDQLVKAGELIGLGGNTGHSHGSHLHFEIRYLGAPINPEDIIDFGKGQLISDKLFLTAYHFRYQREIAKLKEACFHKVKSGESLGSIARKYHTTTKTLRKLNRLKTSSLIRTGVKIRVR